MSRPLLALLASLLLAGCPAPDPADPPVPQEGLAASYDLVGDDLYPEGMAFHPDERAFFFGSLGDGAVRRLDADGEQRVVFAPGEGWVSLGMKVHPTGALVVCALSGYDTDEQRAEIWVFDVAADERTQVVDLGPLQEGSGCNDVGFDGDGAVYVTDRENPNLYRFELGGQPTVWRTDPALGSSLLGLNGVDLLPGGDALLVTRYLPAALVRVPLDLDQPISEVDRSGDGFGFAPSGADGMIRRGDDMLVAGHTRVLRYTSDDGWLTATGVGTSPPDDIAALTLAEGTLYGLKGEVTDFVLEDEPELPFRIEAIGLN